VISLVAPLLIAASPPATPRPGEERASDPGQRQADDALLSGHWRFLQLEGRRLPAPQRPRQAGLQLRAESSGFRYGASVGCNRLMGSFTAAGRELRLGPAAATRMACPPPIAAWETRLGRVLERTRSWRIRDGRLELQDSRGRTQAVLAPGG
jgi:heat shock protein HslJ